MVTCSNYIIFDAVTFTCGHQWSPAPTIYFCGHIYVVIGTSRNGNLRRSPGGARTLLMIFFVLFLFFVLFFRVVLNKD